MGPLDRVAQFKAIETTRAPIPPRPARAGRLLRPPAAPLGPGEHRRQPARGLGPRCSSSRARGSAIPEMTWKYEVAPGGIDFLSDRVSSARTTRATCSSARPAAPCAAATSSGSTSRTTAARSTSTTSACGTASPTTSRKYDITESESLLFGRELRRHAGPARRAPDGTLYVVSSARRRPPAVYEIRRSRRRSSPGRARSRPG